MIPGAEKQYLRTLQARGGWLSQKHGVDLQESAPCASNAQKVNVSLSWKKKSVKGIETTGFLWRPKLSYVTAASYQNAAWIRSFKCQHFAAAVLHLCPYQSQLTNSSEQRLTSFIPGQEQNIFFSSVSRPSAP